MLLFHGSLIAGLFISCLAVNGAQAPQKALGAALSGQALGDPSGEPLRGAHLVLLPTGDDPSGQTLVIRETHSNQTGGFTFDNVAPGSYRLVAAHPKVISTDSLGTMRGRPVPLLRLSEGEQLNAKFRFQEKLHIDGRVTLENGEPAEEAKVEAILLNRVDGLLLPTLLRETVADRNGRYDLSDLRPGKYVVRATLRMPTVMRLAKTTFDPRPISVGFSNGSPGLLESSPIILTTASQSADIRLTSSNSLSIRGTIATSSGASAQAFLIPADATQRGLDAFETSADPQGTFDFENLAPGVYHLVGAVRTEDGAIKEFSLDEIHLGSRSIDDRKIRTVMTATISVSLRIGQNSSVGPKPPLRVFLTPTRQELLAAGATYQGATNTEGKLMIPHIVPGNYRISFEGTEAIADAVEVDGVPLKPGASVGIGAGQALVIRTQVSTARSKVSGRVLRPENSAIGGVVILMPAESDRRSDSANFHTAEMDQNGTFEFAGVPPGKYIVAATVALGAQQFMDPSLMTSLAQHGKEIEVGDPAKGAVSIDGVRLQP